MKINCIICLLDKPKTKKHDAPCECKPHLHQKCLNIWYLHNPNECPICRINYEDIGVIAEVINYNELDEIYERNNRNAKRYALCFLFGLIIYFALRTFFV
jgi:hypothetical protein